MKSILIVDDEQGFVLALEYMLQSAGYNVITAVSGEDGLIRAKDNHPDIILLDIMMPGVGGLETLRFLKSHPQLKNIPVILLSGARPLVRQAEYKWSEFLNKPFSTKALLDTISKLITAD